MQTNKKQREVSQLQRFKGCWHSFPPGPIDLCEEPDFIVHTPVGAVGVELTEVFVPTPPEELPMQAKENLEAQIVQEAEQIYSTQGGSPASTTVYFSERLTIRKADVTQIAKELAEAVIQTTLPVDGSMILGLRWNHPPLPNGVVRVSVHRYPRQTQGRWTPFRAGFVWEPEPADVQRLIDKKNARTNSYRRRCDNVWLVIVALGRAPSQFVEPSKMGDHLFKTSFERVFFLDYVYGYARELRAQK